MMISTNSNNSSSSNHNNNNNNNTNATSRPAAKRHASTSHPTRSVDETLPQQQQHKPVAIGQQRWNNNNGAINPSNSSTSSPSKKMATMTLFLLGWTIAFGIGHYFGGSFSSLTSSSSSTGNDCHSSSSFSISSTMSKDNTNDNHDKFHAVTSKYGPVTRIALLGERNSGTTWMVDHLKECFAHNTNNTIAVNVTPGLTRDKHWFQSDDRTEPRQSVVVLTMFRNVYDWSLAMRKRPHHSPLHLHLHWSEFLSTPWTMPRPERDLPLQDISGPICQLGYSYRQIVPCLRAKQKPLNNDTMYHDTTFSGWDAQYEHRTNGSAYASLLDLRADKIRNHLATKSWDWVADMTILQYEQLLRDGSKGLLKHLEKLTGQKAKCDPTPPAPERLRNYNHRSNFLEFMADRVDWEAEALIGYSIETEGEKDEKEKRDGEDEKTTKKSTPKV